MGEGLAHHFDAALEFGLYGDVDAVSEQLLDVIVLWAARAMRVRFCRGGRFDGEMDGRSSGWVDEEDARELDAGRVENLRAGDVAQMWEAGGGEVLERADRRLDDEHGNAGGAEGAGGGAAGTAIAGEDDVVGERLRRFGDGQFAGSGVAPAAPGAAKRKRGGRHGGERGQSSVGAESEVMGGVGGAGGGVAGLPAGAEREFADLGEAEADDPGGHVGIAEGPGDAAGEEGFAGEDGEDGGGDERGVGDDKLGIEEHADGDEEEQAEDVAEGDDIGERLMS